MPCDGDSLNLGTDDKKMLAEELEFVANSLFYLEEMTLVSKRSLPDST